MTTPHLTHLVAPLVWKSFTYYSKDDDGGPREGIPTALFAWRAAQYTIIRQRGQHGLYLLRGKSDGIGLAVSSLEAAKAAAQDDYAARTIAALDPAALADMIADAEQRGRDAEREACAQMSDLMSRSAEMALGMLGQSEHGPRVGAAILVKRFAQFAAAIRARGNT